MEGSETGYPGDRQSITDLLFPVRGGDPVAMHRLFSLVCGELRG
jgi:hypothetical protein